MSKRQRKEVQRTDLIIYKGKTHETVFIKQKNAVIYAQAYSLNNSNYRSQPVPLFSKLAEEFPTSAMAGCKRNSITTHDN